MKAYEHYTTKLKVYLIASSDALSHGKDLPGTIEGALEGGVRAIQLREKGLSSRELFRLAEEVRKLTDRYGSLLFINDRVDIARAVRADGVHLGAHSMPADVVKSLVGHDLLVGVSTHTLAELEDAINGGADFVTFGPVYYTPSKAKYGEPVGTAALKEACAQAGDLPVLALGGITPDRVEDVLAAGARGVGVVSSIFGAEDPKGAAYSLVQKFTK